MTVRKEESLLQRIRKHRDECKKMIQNERTKEMLFDELRRSKLWKYDPVDIRIWELEADKLDLTIRHASIDFVIEFFCGPLHRKFDIDWELVPHQFHLSLKSTFKDIRIWFDIYEEDMQSCILKKRIKHIRPREEVEKYRVDYEYIMDCGGE